jgi:hypothetical protein
MEIVVDIETIPDQTPGAVDKIAEDLVVKAPDLTKPKLIEALDLGADGKYKTVPELKEMWLEEFGKDAKLKQAKDKWLKTSFDGGYGEICCIGISGMIFTTKGSDERSMLTQFWESVDASLSGRFPFFIAHNAKFDLPFIYHRSVINGVKPVRGFNPHGRHDQDHYCTMEGWAGFNGKIGLDRLAKILGITGKEGMSGADVWPEYEKGNLAGIAEYCQDDVRITSEIYNKLKFK